MDSQIRVKAVIKRHNNPDHTGMIHLCNSAYYDGEEKGRDKRKRLFPIGIEVMAKPAHWYGGIQVFNAYNSDGDFDYFDHSEIQIIETEKLFELYPNAGYGNNKEVFEKYMAEFNYL